MAHFLRHVTRRASKVSELGAVAASWSSKSASPIVALRLRRLALTSKLPITRFLVEVNVK
jgi:hypothetical protein